MGRILGLDLGTNSIGWALVDDKTNEILDLGVRIYPSQERTLKRTFRKYVTESKFAYSLKFLKTHKQKAIGILFITLFSITSFMTIINTTNWQFWLNISLTVLISFLTLIHPKDK